MKTTKPCVCLTEQPNVKHYGGGKTFEADPKCYFCRGTGSVVISVSHDPPPAPIRGADWNAMVDGSETGPMGYGASSTAAVDDLLIRMVEVSN